MVDISSMCIRTHIPHLSLAGGAKQKTTIVIIIPFFRVFKQIKLGVCRNEDENGFKTNLSHMKTKDRADSYGETNYDCCCDNLF